MYGKYDFRGTQPRPSRFPGDVPEWHPANCSRPPPFQSLSQSDVKSMTSTMGAFVPAFALGGCGSDAAVAPDVLRSAFAPDAPSRAEPVEGFPLSRGLVSVADRPPFKAVAPLSHLPEERKPPTFRSAPSARASELSGLNAEEPPVVPVAAPRPLRLSMVSIRRWPAGNFAGLCDLRPGACLGDFGRAAADA